jgi:hypothetical protein
MAKSHPLLVDIGEGLSLMIGLPTLSSWNVEDRPKNAKRGTFGFNSQTGNLEYWDGSAWYETPLSQA